MALPLDQVFSTTVLNVLVPDTSLEFPPEIPTDEWLSKAQSHGVERGQAFFDEQLQSLLLLRIHHPDSDATPDPQNPPETLLDLLAHVQISLEATYISSAPVVADTPRTSRLLATPRTGSLARPSGRLNPHPSILPPSTPNPTPSTGDRDRKYTTAEGTVLAANIWGTKASDDSPEAFALLWSEEQNVWMAVYRLAVTVSFLRLTFSDPLLCLTVSATLRDKPIQTTPKHPLARFLASIGEKQLLQAESPTEATSPKPQEDEPQLLDGLEEVNLLDGLLASTTFARFGPEELNLPSLRLGSTSRQKMFLLPPVLVSTPIAPSPSPMTAVRKAHPTLRKSYRKTLQTASGFRVRMRTVFVPYVLLPETESTVTDLNEDKKERERQDASSEERTIILCVEIENSGDFGSAVGFLVERVQVTIGGEGAKATLIGWGDHSFTADAAKNTFPLRIGPRAQFNLLYAVTFMRSPEETDAFSFARDGKGNTITPDLQRAVTINIFGKPYVPPPATPSLSVLVLENDPVSFPTRTFSSRWNCVLDLAAQQSHNADALDDSAGGYPSVLPEPASPFPVFALHSANANNSGTPVMFSADSTPQYSATAGSRRFTISPGVKFAGHTLKNLTPNRSFLRPEAGGGRDQSPIVSGRLSSQAMSTPGSAAQYLRSPTTYSAPPPPPLLSIQGQGSRPMSLAIDPEMTTAGLGIPTGALDTPETPAYPSYPPRSMLPATPMSQGPIASAGAANFNTSVDIRRERSMTLEPSGPGAPPPLPPTPLPHIPGAFGEQKMLSKLQNASASGENVVVSVGLLPLAEERKEGKVVLGPGRIYPLDRFTLDIFVFNQSSWPRRFEVTCPDRRRRRRGGTDVGVYEGGEAARKMGYPGVLPMDSRVRIGPLRPSACQSVRMNFLAVSPGVHSIDTLTLTDTETGFAMNLRSVMDIVVHDPRD